MDFVGCGKRYVCPWDRLKRISLVNGKWFVDTGYFVEIYCASHISHKNDIAKFVQRNWSRRLPDEDIEIRRNGTDMPTGFFV